MQLKPKDLFDKEEILDFVSSCIHENGGIGASVGHDSHLLYTLSAIQVFILGVLCCFKPY